MTKNWITVFTCRLVAVIKMKLRIEPLFHELRQIPSISAIERTQLLLSFAAETQLENEYELPKQLN